MYGSEAQTRYKIIEDYPPPHERKAEPRQGLELPPGTTVVSADNHFMVGEDIFYDRFPASMKAKAPRIWRSGTMWDVGFEKNKSMFVGPVRSILGEMDQVAGHTDIEARVEDLQREGVDKEIAFPGTILALLFHPDFDVRETAFRIYNEYLAETQSKAPGVFHGVGLVNHWDPSKAHETIREIKALGLKTFMMPMKSGTFRDGSLISYSGEEMEPYWEAAEECGLPICFHIGEGTLVPEQRGAFGTIQLINAAPFRKTVGELVFGGVLDRHPSLRIVFAEGNINWLPAALQDAENGMAAYRPYFDWQLANPPEHYWRTNLYATFMDDALGLSMIDRIGADRVMWSTDYPHAEGNFGHGWSSIRQVLEATTEENAKLILGGNAITLFDLE